MNDRHQLREVRVGDDLSAWAAADFAAQDGEIVIGSTAIVPVGTAGARGIVALGIDGFGAGSLDGIPVAERRAPLASAGDHPNGVERWDHLVMMSPDADRTTAALEATGLDAQRVRTFAMGGATQRQTFFWLGDVILEMVGPDDAHDSGPAVAWGVAFTCPDLDASVAALGDRCGAPKDAVQPGRRIATVRTRDLDISVPIALMSPHAD